MNTAQRLKKLESDLQITGEGTRQEQVEREAGERLSRQWLEYINICDSLLGTIPELYHHIIQDDLARYAEDEIVRLLWDGGFLRGPWSIRVSPLLTHVLMMAQRHQRRQLDRSGGYDGPMVVPAETCEVLMSRHYGEVEFCPASNGGTQCRECSYWLPIESFTNRAPGWKKPLLDKCPVCSGEPVNFDRRHEIKKENYEANTTT